MKFTVITTFGVTTELNQEELIEEYKQIHGELIGHTLELPSGNKLVLDSAKTTIEVGE